MKYIFESASTVLPTTTNPHRSTVRLHKSKNGWNSGILSFKDPEEWLTHVTRQFLLLNIPDVICIAATPQSDREAHKLDFYFRTAAQCYQFNAVCLPNVKGDHTRPVTASSANESLHQERKIKIFFEEMGITHALSRKDDKTLIVTTSCRQDDMIIAMQVANKAFDPPPTFVALPSQPKVAALLRSNEKV